MAVVAAETNITITRTEHEDAPDHGARGTAPLPLSAKPASDHGDLLLAVPRSRHLGIHYPLPCTIPESGSGVCNLLSGSAHPLGYSISIATRNYDLVSRRNLGEKSDEPLRESAQAERVPGGHHGHEHLQGHLCIDRDGTVCRTLLLLQHLHDRPVAVSLRA